MKIDNRIRGKDGRYKRSRKLWSLDNFNDGYIDKKGRFRVYKPDHKRSYKGGYILRSIAAYEAYHNVIVEKHMDVHHIDHNKLNDSKNNLELIDHAEHTKLHKTKPKLLINKICKRCNISFKIIGWRSRQGRGIYCSSICYQQRGTK